MSDQDKDQYRTANLQTRLMTSPYKFNKYWFLSEKSLTKQEVRCLTKEQKACDAFTKAIKGKKRKSNRRATFYWRKQADKWHDAYLKLRRRRK